jgi:hypothetical protein
MPDIYDKILTKVLTEDNRGAPWGMVVAILRTEIAKTHIPRARIEWSGANPPPDDDRLLYMGWWLEDYKPLLEEE